MLEIKKYAAIDIGSNGVRMLISNVIITHKGAPPIFKKSELVRVPIRLGADTFFKGEISDYNKVRIVKAIKAFKLLMEVNEVEKYQACATSAMREASNGVDVAKEVLNKTDVQIDIIDGEKEAAIIFSNDLTNIIKKDKSYLYVDVGGGSTEFTVFSDGEIKNSKSFKMGTLRFKKNKKIGKEQWENVENWIKENTNHLSKISLIGSGGNINKIFKLSGKLVGKPLSSDYLKSYYQFLKQMTYEQRISELGLNPDRADVIIPATKIYLLAMKWSNAKKIYVPKIGLADGIVKNLYINNKG